MKNVQFFKKLASGSMILAVMASSILTSCYGDEFSALEDRVENIENRLTALEQKLNSDLSALQTLLEGQINVLAGKVDELITISSCEKQSDGSHKVTLSDGTVFTVYPEYKADHTGLVTTTELGDVLYWAVYEDGKPVVVTDENGKPIPVVDVVPQVSVDEETGYVQISFDGGENWIGVGYDEPCVFADAEVVTNELDGMPMYVTLTLADGNTITVTIDGAATFMFGNPYMGGVTKVQYIGYGETTAISVMAMGIEDWVKEVPAGWKVEENTQYLAEYGQAEFYVTAPSAEAIASGAAVAEGDLKVLAVAQGGKSITASVKLTTLPFKTVAAAKGNLTVDMNNGLAGYLVGVTPVADFDADAIKAELKAVVEYYEEFENWYGDIMKEYPWSPWYPEDTPTTLDDHYMDGSVEDYPIADLGIELVDGEMYVVWAAALNMWYDNITNTQGYTVGDIASTPYLNAFINVAESLVSFNDIQLEAEFVGVTAFYGAFEEQYPGDPTTVEDVVMNINEAFSYGYSPEELYVNDVDVEGWNEGVYTGNPKDLVKGYQEIEPGTDYYLYLVPVVPGKTVYTAADVYWFEFTTESLMADGTVVPTAGEAVLDYKKITVPLSAENAVYIYYKFEDPEMMSTIADKQAYLLENGTMAKGASVNASIANINPSQTKTLLAMAVDQYGCYGDVFVQEYTSKALDYAAATVTAEVQGTPSLEGLVKISCDADVKTFYYWYGTQDSYQWTNTAYFGGSADAASSFIALTPNSYLLKKVTPANLPEEGIAMTGLTIGAPSLFVVSAELNDGTYTKATVVTFTPAMDLGNFVYATDDNGNENPVWAAAKPTVTPTIETVGDFTTVSWTVSLPEGFSAKTACFHSDYLMDYPSAKSKVQFILSYEYIDTYDVVEGETYFNHYASNGCHIYTVVWDADGNYYETYVTELDIKGGFGV